MKILRKTFLTATVFLFAAVLMLFIALVFSVACSEKITLSFETFGGTKIGAISENAGEKINPPEDPVKEGLVFTGWYLNKACSGEKQILPTTMPNASVTYYAKFEYYPTLTLDAGGGSLSETALLVKPGTNLKLQLKSVSPSKPGLSFGGWTLDGSLLQDDAVMPESDLTLRAKYVASYRVEIYTQDASSREDFSLCSATDNVVWEGETVSPALPSLDRFTLDPVRSSPRSVSVGAGENTYRYYFLREDVRIAYFANPPEGVAATGDTPETVSFYGGTAALSESKFLAEGHRFLGWATDPLSDHFLLPGEELETTEDLTLYAVWGKVYSDGRGGGNELAVCVNPGENGTRAFFFDGAHWEEGSCSDGIYRSPSRIARMDGHGNFLLSDGGTYFGFSLAQNCVSEACGTLELNFEESSARYVCGEQTLTGGYEYLYDETEKKYRGIYSFETEEESFLFLLKDGNFLKEGEEKQSYLLYEGKLFNPDVTLELDGLGSALYTDGETVVRGSYRGGTRPDEWEICLENGESFFVLTGISEQKIGGETVLSVRFFLLKDALWEGRFASDNATLVLDGYGLSAVYTVGEEIAEGTFTVEGDIVTFRKSDGTVLVFVLDRENLTFSIQI